MTSLILYSYNGSGVSKKETCVYGEENQKQAEFPILRSLSHILLTSGE